MKRFAVLGFLAALLMVALVAARADARPQVATPTVLKFLVDKGGWYRVPAATIASAGFSPSNWTNVHLSTGPPGVPGTQDVRYQEAGGAVEFYGQALDIPTSDTRTYWLSEGTTPGPRIQSVSATGPTNLTGTFPATLNMRDRQYHYSSIVNGVGNNDFGIATIFSGGPAVSRSFELSNVDVSQTATLRVDLQGYSATAHNVNVNLVNANGTTTLGSVIGTCPPSPQPCPLSSGPLTVPINKLVNGTNSIAFSTSAAGAFTLTDAYNLTYKHFFVADGDALEGARLVERVAGGALRPAPSGGPVEGFAVTPGQTLSVGGFTSNDIRLADVSTPMSPRELLPTITSSGSPFTIGITVPGSTTSLYAFTGAKVLAPKQVLQDTSSSLRATSNQADLIVVGYRDTSQDFLAAVQPLVNRRVAEGLSVDVVDVQDVFDEFGSSFGAHDPNAIHDFILYAKSSWANPKPRYVLLVGDGNTDSRNYMGFGNKDFVPTAFVNATFQPEPPSDDSLADADAPGAPGYGVPELAVGRLPALSASEANAMAMKISNYASVTGHAKTALLAADNYDRGDYHFGTGPDPLSNNPDQVGYSDYLKRESLDGNAVAVTKVYRSSMPPPNPGPGSDQAKRDEVIAQASLGPTIVNWFGHGTVAGWAGSPPLLHRANMPLLTNASLSLYLMMTCQNAYFVDPDVNISSLGEGLLRTPNGAVAVWGSSGDTTPTDQVTAAKVAVQRLFSQPATRLGDAMLEAKAAVSDIDVLHTWTLLGDPTTQLNIRGPTAVVLKSFTAMRAARNTVLRWRTATEPDVLGFNVYRFAGGKKVKVNRALVAAKRSGTARGASYRLVDRPVRPASSYTYRLEIVSLTGKRSWAATAALRAAK